MTTHNISLKQHLHQVLHDESLADEVIEVVCQWLENMQSYEDFKHLVSYKQLIQCTVQWNLPEYYCRELPHIKWMFPDPVKIEPTGKDEIPF